MSTTTPDKFTAFIPPELDGEVVVFLTGMRINKWWRPSHWLPVFMAMGGMLSELRASPELGLLGHHAWFGQTMIVLQYWRSHQHLEDYARAKQRRHMPAWVRFMKRIGVGGDVGIWHETYLVRPGNYETVYVNMPAFGLAAATEPVAITRRTDSAMARIDAGRASARQSEKHEADAA